VRAIGDFESLFGDCLSPDKEREWAATQSSLGVGESVRGRVVDRRPIGVFEDIGVSFPTLLEVAQFKDSRQRRYRLEDYPGVGDMITARVVAFNNQNRQIRLTQIKSASLARGISTVRFTFRSHSNGRL
jgi:ribosomal protein S1